MNAVTENTREGYCTVAVGLAIDTVEAASVSVAATVSVSESLSFFSTPSARHRGQEFRPVVNHCDN
jgi:hypothetical protein